MSTFQIRGRKASQRSSTHTLLLTSACLLVQQRLWEHLDLTMRAAQHAEQVLRTTNINDEDAVDGMTALIEQVARKHDGIRNEMASHGVTVPVAPSPDMSQALGPTGRRMAMERQIGDIKEACVQVLLFPVCVAQGGRCGMRSCPWCCGPGHMSAPHTK
jgi:hypothetical protein